MITVSTKVLFQDGKVNQRVKKLLGEKSFYVIAYLENDINEEGFNIRTILNEEGMNWRTITFVSTPFQEAKQAVRHNSLHFTDNQAVRKFLTQQGLFVVYMTKE